MLLMKEDCVVRSALYVFFCSLGLTFLVATAEARPKVKLDLERYRQLREAERYQIDLAEKMYHQRNYQAALAEFEKFIRIYQAKSVGSPYAQWMIARCHEHLNNINTAIREYKAVTDYFPRSEEAPLSQLAIARCHDRLDEVKEAIAAYLATAKTYPETDAASQALWGASEIARRKDQRDKCVEFRERIFHEYPKSSRHKWVAFWLARYYIFEKSDLDKARTFLKGIFEKPEDVEYALARNLYYIHPRDNYPHPRPWEWGSAEFSPKCARYAHDSKNAKVREKAVELGDEAVRICRAIRDNFPESPRARDAWQLIAQIYYHTGRAPQAAVELRKYLEKHPDDDGQRGFLGACLEAMKLWDEARLEYLKFKNKYSGKDHVGLSYRNERKFKEAIDVWQGMVTEFPDQATRCLYRIARTHQYWTRDYEKAIFAWRNSEYSPPYYQFRIGECYRALKKREEAIKTYREIVTFFPDHGAEALWRIGHLYEELKMPKYAVAIFRRICSKYPKSGYASNAARVLEHKYKIDTGGGVKEGTEVHIDWLEK